MKSWNENDIKRLRLHYLKLLRTTTDKKEQKRLRSIIQNIDESIKTICFDKVCGQPTHSQIIATDYECLNLFGDYAPYIRQLNEQANYVHTDNFSLQKINITKSSILNFNKDFYESISKEYKKYFDILMGGKAYLNLKKGRSDTFGTTYPIYGTPYSFIDIFSSDNIMSFISSSHEIAHAIENLIKRDPKKDPSNFVLSEVNSTFFELLSADFALNSDDFCNLDVLKMQIATFNKFINYAAIACIKMDLLSILPEDKLMNKKYVKSYLHNEYSNNAQKVLKYMLSDVVHYIISFLVAVELYLIYLDNQEEALSKLRKVTLLGNLSNIAYLNELKKLDIVPGNNFDKYIEIITKKQTMLLI